MSKSKLVTLTQNWFFLYSFSSQQIDHQPSRCLGQNLGIILCLLSSNSTIYEKIHDACLQNVSRSQFLFTTCTAVTLVHTTIISHLDYVKSLLSVYFTSTHTHYSKFSQQEPQCSFQVKSLHSTEIPQWLSISHRVKVEGLRMAILICPLPRSFLPYI